jgi:ABC-type glycerol-3-phosphate transport system substrate-binding protein
MKRLVSLALVLLLCIALLAGCSSSSAPASNGGSGNSTTPTSSAPAEGGSDTPAGDNGATDDNPWSGFDTSKEVNLVFYAVGTKNSAHDYVIGKANARMKELINTTVDVEIIPLSDFQTKYPLVLAGGEDVDIIMTHPYIGPFTTHADNGAFMELTDEFLHKWMPVTMQTQVPASWKQAMYKGKLMQIPRNDSDFEQAYGVVVRKDMMEKYNIGNITSVDDFQKYLYAVADGEKNTGMYAMYVNPTSPMSLTFVQGVESWQTAGSALWDSKKPGKINPDDLFLMQDTEEYKNYCLRMADWAKHGVWPSSAITGTTHITDLFSESKSASDICMYKAANSDILDAVTRGFEAEYYNILPPGANTRIAPYNYDALAITSFSKNQERAALAVDVMKNDYEVTNLLQGGVEGEHYILDPVTNTHSLGPKAEEYAWSGWAWCLRSLQNPGEGGIVPSVMAIREDFGKRNVDASLFTVDGFSVDNSAFEAESANLNSLSQEWASSFDLGVFGDDTEKKLNEYIGLLKAAGSDKILEATKVQLKQFIAENY